MATSDFNRMQFLRRWATDNQHASENIAVSSDAAVILSDAILQALSILDGVHEKLAGRALTEFEKFGPDETHSRCPDCRQPVPGFFDHIATDCLGMNRD